MDLVAAVVVDSSFRAEQEDGRGVDATDEDEGSVSAELHRLREAIRARKEALKDSGCGICEVKKDRELAALVKRQGALFCRGDRYEEKVRKRCRERGHFSVLLSEAVAQTTALGPDGRYVDCTFGRGGHSRAILARLSPAGRLLAFDVDPLAVDVGRALQREDPRFEVAHRPFGDIGDAAPCGLAGVLLDLGVSSPQLDDSSRGFSTKARKVGPLDLRMNPLVGAPASQWLQTVTAAELAWVIRATAYELGPPLPERVAEAILSHQRRHGPYATTGQLACMLEEFSEELGEERPKTGLAHVVFCAIRVFLNREQEQLEVALEGAFEKLQPHGRCVIICFSRWEASVVRAFVRRHEAPRARVLAELESQPVLSRLYPLLGSGKRFSVRHAVPPIRPSQEEIQRNGRSKSIMYTLEKVPR